MEVDVGGDIEIANHRHPTLSSLETTGYLPPR